MLHILKSAARQSLARLYKGWHWLVTACLSAQGSPLSWVVYDTLCHGAVSLFLWGKEAKKDVKMAVIETILRSH